MFLLLSTSVAMTPASDPRPFWSLFTRRDTDDDGVPDRHDACVVLPENINGYEDGDGCPDRLTTLVMGAFFRGKPVDDAVLIAEVGGKRHEGVGELKITDLIPSDTARLMASAGCLTSQATLDLTESAQRVRMKMHITGNRAVNVHVIDAGGVPVAMATVNWVSTSRPGCGTLLPVLIDDGATQLKVGDGEHEVEVIVRGRRQTVRATLNPGESDLYLQLADRSGRVARGELLPDKVLFASGRSTLRSDTATTLDAMAALLRGNPSTTMTIEGHADERGFDTYNIDLSQRRAVAVLEALVTRGIPSERLQIEALGESEPVSEGYGQTSLAENRRVQFRLIRPKGIARN